MSTAVTPPNASAPLVINIVDYSQTRVSEESDKRIQHRGKW